MFLSRMTLTEAATRERSVWAALADDYRVHQTIWELFGDRKDRQRDFLYRFDRLGTSRRASPVVWTLSEREPQADPRRWHCNTKRVEPRLQGGDRLRFTMRVNPVVTRRVRPQKRQRHDVVMDAIKNQDTQGLDRSEIVQNAGQRWFETRAAAWGVAPLALRVDAYRVARFETCDQHKVSLGTCELTGCLEVCDPETFLGRWRQGFGPAKGYGCGLMLIARTR